MAVELNRYIKDLIERSPEGHRDLPFLQKLQKKTYSYILSSGQNEIYDAERVLDMYVSMYHKLSPLKAEVNRIEQQKWVKEYGEDSVLNLMPCKYFHFSSVEYVLERARIHTGRELMIISPDKIFQLENVGSIKANFVITMRCLAYAKHRYEEYLSRK